jgi:hypothetical protein
MQLDAKDTGYVNATHIFMNHSLPNSVFSYDFNLDGSIDTTTDASVLPFKFTAPATYLATMYDVSCGSNTLSKSVVILNPIKKPVSAFDADNRNPSTRDTVSLYDLSANGATSVTWSITPSTYTLVNSSLTSPVMRVVFNSAGPYNICLNATNSFGSDNLCKTAFINAHTICIPSTAGTLQGIGISHVQIGMMHNVTTQVQGYHDYSQTKIAQLEKGSIGNFIAMDRLVSGVAQTWGIWIDMNQDGSFSASERVGQLVSSTANNVTGTIGVPKSTLSGLTKIRFAAYNGTAVTDGCSAMSSGEIEDYGVMIIGDRTKPVITLLGNNPDSVEIGYNYVEPGATAFDNVNGDITASITRTGTVNTSVIGSYTLRYNVTDSSGNKADEKVRTVFVTKDKTKPAINLTGGDTIYIEVYSKFTDPGATATDLVDGNLSSKITVAGTVDTSIIGSYIITYQVTDNAGNISIKYRRVIVRDTQKPVITLLGSAIINMTRGNPWTDPGTTVTDNYDKNLVATITGTVLTNTLGQYILLYDATDQSGNKAVQVQRTVNVNPPIGVQSSATGELIRISPNPSAGLFELDIDLAVAKHISIRISDINGRLVQDFTADVKTGKFMIDLSAYADGIYLMQLSDGEKVVVKKMVKE